MLGAVPFSGAASGAGMKVLAGLTQPEAAVGVE